MDASEPELMSRLAAGDDLALNVLMDRWGERVASFLHKMTGSRDTAVDLAQETFVKLYQARDRYRPSGSFSTYLFAIASNLARNHARWKSRHRSSAATLVTPYMLRGTDATSSVIQTAGCSGGGVSAAPNALVELVKTTAPTPLADAASSTRSVPATLVSTNALAGCVSRCGLCSVAACITGVRNARRTSANGSARAALSDASRGCWAGTSTGAWNAGTASTTARSAANPRSAPIARYSPRRAVLSCVW